MKYLIRVIMTLPALVLFGLRGMALLWKYGGIFHVNRYNPDKALGLLRDLHDRLSDLNVHEIYSVINNQQLMCGLDHYIRPNVDNAIEAELFADDFRFDL